MATTKTRRRTGPATRNKKGGNRRGVVISICIVIFISLMFGVVAFLFFTDSSLVRNSFFDDAKKGDNAVIKDDEHLYRRFDRRERKNGEKNLGTRATEREANSIAKPPVKTPEYGVKDKAYLDKLIKSR